MATEHARPLHTVTPGDKAILRVLAARVAELAAKPAEDEKRQLWYKHNALEATRPLIFCDPENGWNEIITKDQIACEGRLARRWETTLRREIYWGESMGDDRVVEARFPIYHIARRGDWGMSATHIGGENGGAYRWEAPLKSYDDLHKLKFPEIEVDYAATEALEALALDIFGGLLRVEVRGFWWWSLGLTLVGVKLRGLEQTMLDMCLEPDGLKALMAFLRDGTLAQMNYLEEQGLLTLNNDGTYVGSGGFGYTHELPTEHADPDPVRTTDLWGFCESQETTAVSPDQFEEFVYPYQRPILERFGLNCYGCCEPLDLRWHVIKDIPRLRRVSVSPWCDLQTMADRLGERYIFSMKPSPSALATPAINEEAIRAGLRRAFEITRGCRVEAIMKDNHTIGGNPENVRRWCRIAREEAEAVR